MNEEELINMEIANGRLYEAYTDGSCENVKSKIGGSAYLIIKDGEVIKSNSKGFAKTTNNRMELLAIISALNSIPEGNSVLVYTDSKYCIQVLDGREHGANSDLIKLFCKISKRLNHVFFKWVKGHSGNEYNELADEMAFSAYCEQSKKMGIEIPSMMYRLH